MRNFFEHKTAVFLIVATLILAVLIGVFSAMAAGDKASPAENFAGMVTEPGQAAASGIGGWFQGLFQNFGNVKALRAENEELKRANVELDKEVRDARGLEEENRELRAMLDMQKTENKLDLIAAQVTGKDPSNWYSTFTINRGSNDGIQKNQPVLTAEKELIGQVYKVGSTWAEIITVLDPDSGVGCMVERSKDLGIVEGDASLRYEGLCRLGYLSRNTDVEVGDYVETSGMGGIYPKGLLVGVVVEIQEDNATMSKYAMLQPAVDIGKVNQVFVLKSFTEEIVRETEKDKDDKKETDEKKSDSDRDDDEESTRGNSSREDDEDNDRDREERAASSQKRHNQIEDENEKESTTSNKQSLGAMDGSELSD